MKIFTFNTEKDFTDALLLAWEFGFMCENLGNNRLQVKGDEELLKIYAERIKQ